MKNWVFFVLVLILGILQLTFLDWFKIFNLNPDLLLISAVIISLSVGWRTALALSVFAGLFKDSFGANIFGINTILFSLWSFSIARLNKKISIDNNFMRITLVFMVALLHNTINGIILLYLGRVIPLGIFLRIVLFASIYTTLASPLIYLMVKRFVFNSYRLP